MSSNSLASTTGPIANIALICEYTETGRIEAMARTLDDIRALPEARKETP